MTATATANTDSTLSRENSPGYLINHLARMMEQSLRSQLAPLGVVPGQFAQLLALYERDDTTQRELCSRVQIDQSTMAHTLNRMERDGLIRRTSDPEDKRRARITLTEHANTLRPNLIQAGHHVNAIAGEGLTPAQLAAFRETLHHMIANLTRAVDNGT